MLMGIPPSQSVSATPMSARGTVTIMRSGWSNDSNWLAMTM